MSVIGSIELHFSEEQAMILDTAQEFCRDKSSITAVRALLSSELGYDTAIWAEMVSLGWPGISLPEACGGSQLGVAGAVPVVESMGRALLTTPFISTTLAAQLIIRAGNTQQAERFLPHIIAGEAATVALLENGDWGDEQVACTIDEAGMLRGSKKFVADAVAAQLFVVSVIYKAAPALALVHRDQIPEHAIDSHTLIDETKRAANVDFSGIRVAPENILAGDAVSSALRDIRLIGALLVATEATGAAAACLDSMVEYLKTRSQFGKLIGSYQALKHPTVDILNAVDSSRSFVYHAATLLDDAPLDRDTEIACRMAKAQATETLLLTGDRAVQFHGGMGFTYECDAQLYIRRAQWAQQQFGDAQHHRKRLASLLLN